MDQCRMSEYVVKLTSSPTHHFVYMSTVHTVLSLSTPTVPISLSICSAPASSSMRTMSALSWSTAKSNGVEFCCEWKYVQA